MIQAQWEYQESFGTANIFSRGYSLYYYWVDGSLLHYLVRCPPRAFEVVDDPVSPSIWRSNIIYYTGTFGKYDNSSGTVALRGMWGSWILDSSFGSKHD